MSETKIMRTVPVTDFKTLHAQINPDPMIELNRRLQMWASVPDADGGALSPSGAIVPDETITAALAEITSLRAQLAEARRKAIEDAARVAEGWPVHAAGDDYQTSGNGKFWDAGNVYDQARIDAASAIRALLSESKT